MAQEEVGGPLFVGSGPASEQIPEHDSTVDENQTDVGQITLSDADSSNTFTYSIVSDYEDGSLFAVDSSGLITSILSPS